MLTFGDLAGRFGEPAAYQYLAEIEKIVAIASWGLAEVDPEIRLRNACLMQDAMLDGVHAAG
jgi:hypothetical protein